MTIISALPNTLTNGTTADATQVMANFNQIVNNVNANAANTTSVQSWTAAQRGVPAALTSSAGSIAINLNLANNFTHTTTENTTLAAPTNPVAGQSGVIVITQGAAAKTLAYNSFWKFPSGVTPSLTASAGAVDMLSYYVESATRATCNMLNNVS